MYSQIQHLIDKLDLKEHPEGGYFRETYRSEKIINPNSTGDQFPNKRSWSTAIYYLLKGDQYSKFHRIKSDEIWHFYHGSSASIHILHPGGAYQVLNLGPDFEKGQQFQQIVPAQSWFGVQVDDRDGYLLAGCTVSPGFDFRDFEIAYPSELKQEFPDQAEIIDLLS